ncbi:hydrogenase-4 component F [Hydrogenispora ethanolica]|jgi:hydrogenase-4 component F|uniref:Hydrogenase-4 component F n=1 Tax=Hydrogenispora ethanolica TaxID=1082276 RepID=A0A4R1R8H4_HYDET|nr:proton-conducting transporter membrane subunit [Hydrogenispora ethanolica]TCL61849.1 hydrogenase-4 component F [Hydrogenispora ethanolica]
MEMGLFILAPVVLAAAAFVKQRWLLHVTAAVHLLLAVQAGLAAARIARVKVWAEGFWYLDSLSALFLLVVAVVSLVISLFAVGYYSREWRRGELSGRRLAEYLFWYNLLLAAMYLVVLTANLGILWVAVEATTVTSVLLVGFEAKRAATEAAWKYLLICSVGIIFALLGIMFLYFAALPALGTAGGGAALDWSQLAALAARLDPGLAKLAFIFILIGFGTKVGFAPLHTWLPDAHSQAPTPVSAVLSGVLLNCALYGIIRVASIIRAGTGGGFVDQFLTFFGLFSIAAVIPFILIQYDLKRLLAYSSVENMGIIAFGLGLGGKWAVIGSLLQMANHALTKSSLFLSAGEVVQVFGSKRLHRMKGLMAAAPGLGTVFYAGLLAITGFPPFAIFFSKLTIVYGGLQRGSYGPSLLFLLLLLVICGGLFYYFSRILQGTPSPKRFLTPRKENWATVLVLGLPLGIMLALGFYQPPVWRALIGEAARIIGGKMP